MRAPILAAALIAGAVAVAAPVQADPGDRYYLAALIDMGVTVVPGNTKLLMAYGHLVCDMFDNDANVLDVDNQLRRDNTLNVNTRSAIAVAATREYCPWNRGKF